MKSAPASHAAITSVGVSAPAISNFLSRTASSTVGKFRPGLTRNCAPASRQFCAACAFNTVPAPIRTSEPQFFTSSRITSSAPGTVIVLSTIGLPPSQTASSARHASRAEPARTTGTIPISRMRSRTFCLSIAVTRSENSSTRDARSDSFHHLQNFLQRSHRSISRSRHRQRPMRRATLDGSLRIVSRQKTINQPRRKRIAAANTIKNLQILPVFCLVELALAIANRAPIILRGCLRLAQRGRHHLERIFLHHVRDHLLEAFHFEHGVMLVHPRHFKSQSRGKILFVAQHHVHMRRDA